MPIDGRTPLQAASGTGHGKGRAGPLWGQAASRSGTWAHAHEEAGGEGEDGAISRSEAGLGHRTLQYDDLLAENDVFGEEGGTRFDERTQRA